MSFEDIFFKKKNLIKKEIELYTLKVNSLDLSNNNDKSLILNTKYELLEKKHELLSLKYNYKKSENIILNNKVKEKESHISHIINQVKILKKIINNAPNNKVKK